MRKNDVRIIEMINWLRMVISNIGIVRRVVHIYIFQEDDIYTVRAF